MEFLQNDYTLISGSPEEKRRFLDISCSLLIPGYYKTLLKYNRALKQRNLQIRYDLENGTHRRDLWNEILAETGIFLIQTRKYLINKILNSARERISQMDRVPIDLHIEYTTSFKPCTECDCQKEFILGLKESSRREDIFKSTIFGPHRDGLRFFHSLKDMKSFSSQGQIRMAVLSIKLAVIDLLRIEQNSFPVLLFDDSFIEIDKQNTQMILDSLKEFNQCLFTSTVVPDIPYFSKLEASCFHRFPDWSSNS